MTATTLFTRDEHALVSRLESLGLEAELRIAPSRTFATALRDRLVREARVDRSAA